MQYRLTQLASARLILLWTPSGCRRDPHDILRLALEGGVDLVQVRDKEATARQLYEQTLPALEIVRAAGAAIFVNDRLDVAIAAHADGVHLGQDDMPLSDARRVAPPGFLIGISTHSLTQVRAASDGGADLLGFGPMFPTATKPNETAIGPGHLADAVSHSRAPVFAIGGLDAERIARIGARRAAVSSTILTSSDPKNTAREIRAALERNGPLQE